MKPVNRQFLFNVSSGHSGVLIRKQRLCFSYFNLTHHCRFFLLVFSINARNQHLRHYLAVCSYLVYILVRLSCLNKKEQKGRRSFRSVQVSACGHPVLLLQLVVLFFICRIVGDNMLFCVAKAKTQRTKAFLRVLKYSNGGVLEVISFSSLFLASLGHV